MSGGAKSKPKEPFIIRRQYELRLVFTAVFFVILILLLGAGLSQKVDIHEAKEVLSQFKELLKNIVVPGNLEATSQNIFIHNVYIAVIANTPFLGLPIILFSSYQTGLTAKMIAVASGSYGKNLFLDVLLKPHTILEMLAYAIAASESLYTSIIFFAKKREEYSLLITVGIIILEVSLLFVASILESELILNTI